MAVTCKDIMNLDICSRLKLIGGMEGINNVVTWPFIKNMDTISEWIHGGEMVFIIGAKEDISERGLLFLMDEAVKSRISAVVMLQGDEYIRTIPKSVIRYANENKLPLFKMPFILKLIDITQEISQYILKDRENSREHEGFIQQYILELMLESKSREELLAYCHMKLQPLLEADKVLRTEYVKTLKCYLECNNDLLHSSEHMYIHRNTMINRMKKITALLGAEINETETRNDFFNIFKVMEYYGEI